MITSIAKPNSGFRLVLVKFKDLLKPINENHEVDENYIEFHQNICLV